MNRSTAMEGAFRARATNKHAEEALVRSACGGDKEAFGQLYDMYIDRIYRYVYFRVSDEHIAEDLAATIFMKAWEHLDRYRISSTPFLGWLYTIAHNTVVDHYRTRHPEAELDEAMELRSNDLPLEKQTEALEDATALRGALLRLTPAQREVVSLRHIQGMSTEEIARRMSKTPGAVRALQMRALQQLNKIYAAEEAAQAEEPAIEGI